MKQKTKKAFSFLQNAIKDSISKFHYYECDQKGMHNGQKLTYVCINRHCRSRRLICSICKEDHISHDADVIPLKKFICQIDEIKDTLPKSYAWEKDTREYLETLDQKKNQLLYALRQTVQKIALYFQNLQQEIINQFQSTKIKLLNEISLNRNLRNQIDQLLENLDGDQKAFQKGIDKISACAYRTGKKNQIDFKTHLPQFLDEYRTYSQKTLLKLNQILSVNTSHFENEISTQIDPSSSQPQLASVKKQIQTFQPVPFLSKQLPKDQTDLNKEEIKTMKELSSYSFSTLLKRQGFNKKATQFWLKRMDQWPNRQNLDLLEDSFWLLRELGLRISKFHLRLLDCLFGSESGFVFGTKSQR